MNLLPLVISTAIDLLAMMVCIGLLATEAWVIPRGVRKETVSLFPEEESKLSPFYALHDGLWRLLGLALAGLTLMSAISLLQRTAEMSGLPWKELFSAVPLVLSGTHYGMTWFVRMIAMAVLWFGWWRGRKGGSRQLIYIMLLAAAGVAWSVSASSHAADWGDFTLPEWMSWLHIMAASLWVGGILAFVLLIRRCLQGQSEQERQLFAACASGLSRLAGIALALVLVTGPYNVWRQLHGLSDLWSSGYGRIIMFKLMLVGLMVALGAISRYFTLPFLCQGAGVPLSGRQTGLPLWIWRRLRPSWRPREGDALARQFGRRVMVEAWLALGVLIFAAMLGHAMPPMKQPVNTIHHVMEPLAKLVSSDRLPHCGPFLSWNFAPWNHHAAHSIPKMDSKWDCRSSTQSFASGSRVSDSGTPAMLSLRGEKRLS